MRRGTLGAFCFAVSLPASTQTLLIPALPVLAEERGFSATANGWLLSAFLLGASISAPVVGRLGDLWGRRPLTIAVSAGYAVGAAICLFGGDHALVVAIGRALQGFSAGVYVLQVSALQELSPPAARASRIAVLSGFVALGPAVGFLVGGLVTAHLGVTTLFAAGIGLGVVSTAVLWWRTPDSGGAAEGAVDVPGAVLVAASLFAVLLALTEVGVAGPTGRSTLLWAGAAAVALATTGWWMRRSPSPFIDVSVLASPVTGLVCAATVLNAAALFGLFVMVPQLVQDEVGGYGLGPVEAGLFLVPGAASMVVVGMLAGRRGGFVTTIVRGNLLCAAAMVALAVLPRSMPVVLVLATVAAIGIGLAFPLLPAVAMAAVPPRSVGAAAGVNSLMRGMGSAAGAQVALVVAASTVAGGSAYGRSFLASAIAAALAALAAAGLRGGPAGRA